MHHPSLLRCIHISDLRCGRPFCCCLWAHRVRKILFDTKDVPKTQVELGEVEQTVPVCVDFLEWMGCCGLVLAVPVAGYGGYFELFVSFPTPSSRRRRADGQIDAPIIMAAVTIFALISWWFTPSDAWLPKERISHFVESAGIDDILAEHFPREEGVLQTGEEEDAVDQTVFADK